MVAFNSYRKCLCIDNNLRYLPAAQGWPEWNSVRRLQGLCRSDFSDKFRHSVHYFCALLLPEGDMSRAFAECPDRRHWRDHGSQSRDDASRREINRIGRTLAKRRTSGRAGAQGRKRQITLRDKGAPSLVCGNSFDPAALGRPVGHDGGRHRRSHTFSFTLIATAARPEGAGADKLPREPPTCRVESSPAGSLRSCGDGTARPCGSRRRSPDDGSE